MLLCVQAYRSEYSYLQRQLLLTYQGTQLKKNCEDFEEMCACVLVEQLMYLMVYENSIEIHIRELSNLKYKPFPLFHRV